MGDTHRMGAVQRMQVALHIISIMFYNRKGGVGKTIDAINVAIVLAALGFKVAIVDGDDQMNATSLDVRKQWKATLTNVIKSTQFRGREYSPEPLLNAMIQIRKNLWLIPGDNALKEARDYIGNRAEHEVFAERMIDLRKTLPPAPPWETRFSWWTKTNVTLRDFDLDTLTSDEEYVTPPEWLDFVFWDSPPEDTHLTKAMMLASDKIMVPIKLDQYSADGLPKVLEAVDLSNLYRERKVQVVGIVPNDVIHQGGDDLTLKFLKTLYRDFPALARRPIHHDSALQHAPASKNKRTALELNHDGRGIREIAALALRIIGYRGIMAGVPDCHLCAEAREEGLAEARVLVQQRKAEA